MTIYHRIGREIELVGADLSGDTDWRVWWAYAESELDDDTPEGTLDSRHRGINESPLNQLRADGGIEEVMARIAELPANRVQSQEKARSELAEDC